MLINFNRIDSKSSSDLQFVIKLQVSYCQTVRYPLSLSGTVDGNIIIMCRKKILGVTTILRETHEMRVHMICDAETIKPLREKLYLPEH